MDTRYEDTMLSQIEKKLSDNIDENLFLTGRGFDVSTSLTKKKYLQEQEGAKSSPEEQEYPLVSTGHIRESAEPLSRAELIRQAREACLRQLSSTQPYCKPYDVHYHSTELSNELPVKKKQWKLLPDGRSELAGDDASPQEVAAYRSLIIRAACALVLFLIIFLIDKFELGIGSLTNNKIEEYITGKNALKALEDMIVTWLK